LNGTSLDGVADAARVHSSTNGARTRIDSVELSNGECVELR
jgi:hypothetical protein